MSKYIESARKVIEMESKAIAALADRLDDNFEQAVEAMLNCSGRVIVAGMWSPLPRPSVTIEDRLNQSRLRQPTDEGPDAT